MRSFGGAVRRLREADLPQVQRILGLWVRESPSSPPLHAEIAFHLERMSRSLTGDRDCVFLVATAEDERVIGVVGMQPTDPEMMAFARTERPVEMINAYIEPQRRDGFGVGTTLIQELETVALAQGYKEIVLNSGPRYQGSGWGFFDKLEGYERRGVAKGLYGQGLDAPVWSKIL